MFKKIDHINMAIRELTESAEWYQKVFGFTVAEIGLSSYGTPYQILQLNDFSLCQYEMPKHKSAAEDDHGIYLGIYHFGLRVSDPDTWKKKIQQLELKIHLGPIAYPHSTSWYLYDPSGHEIEVSYAPNGTIF